ncbi:hypothetical protein [Neorhizobium sp. P12A]|uniref:hypothetical protein n=1 Tax=Neorhizobium sp. P12A TaxID=2268027 RepID=UPI0011ED9263|nr:hypothetical protein [Neorhizobium sp. P12A]
MTVTALAVIAVGSGTALLVAGVNAWGVLSIHDYSAPSRPETREDVYNLPCDDATRSTSYENFDLNRRRGALIESTHPVDVDLGPWKLAVPWGYWNSRPFVRTLNCRHALEALWLQYWIPSLDAPEREMIYVSNTDSPVEERRPNPRPEESVVQAMLKPYGPGLHDKRSTAGWLIESQNLVRGGAGIVQDGGLWKTTVPVGALKAIYWFRSSEIEDLVIRCDPISTRCMGEVDFKDLSLEATLIFNRNAVSQHVLIVDGLRSLLSRWQLTKAVSQ